jgi:hypothetical protein
METSKFLYKLAPPKVQEELSRKQQEVKKVVSDRTSNLLDSFLGHRTDSSDSKPSPASPTRSIDTPSGRPPALRDVQP